MKKLFFQIYVQNVINKSFSSENFHQPLIINNSSWNINYLFKIENNFFPISLLGQYYHLLTLLEFFAIIVTTIPIFPHFVNSSILYVIYWNNIVCVSAKDF